jgi:16S rRNA (cytidine1402-2'-O)-methyltransferase
MTSLYVIATPIGNLEDITNRALRILSEVDLILCEDTRETKKLLDRYGIKTPTLSYHQHSEVRKVEEIMALLKEGKNLALVSDAGTPGISDPGSMLINKIVAEKLEVNIIPLPGPSAFLAAISISGFPADRFLFLGFPPVKKRRNKFFEEVTSSKHPVVFYESTHRIVKTLTELGSVSSDRKAVVCRELTKKFETIYRGNVEKVLEDIKKDDLRGEFVVVLEGGK